MLPPQGCSWSGADSCELPRRALRHLIVGHGLHVGSRVFDTGAHSGPLLAFLKSLQLEALGWSDLRRGAERSLSSERLRDLLAAAGPFDLMVAREMLSLDCSLFGPASLTATAQLLSCLRPGGSLVCIGRCDLNAVSRRDHHLASCYQRHLQTFPGRVTLAEFPDGLLHADPLRWIARRQGRTLLASLRIPETPMTAREWLAAATAGASAASCCPAFAARIDRSHAA